MVTRERIHQIVDALPESELASAERMLDYLQHLSDPVGWALSHAPIDDEPETPEEAEAVAEAWEDVRRGDVISHEEIMREFRR